MARPRFCTSLIESITWIACEDALRRHTGFRKLRCDRHIEGCHSQFDSCACPRVRHSSRLPWPHSGAVRRFSLRCSPRHQLGVLQPTWPGAMFPPRWAMSIEAPHSLVSDSLTFALSRHSSNFRERQAAHTNFGQGRSRSRPDMTHKEHPSPLDTPIPWGFASPNLKPAVAGPVPRRAQRPFRD